ncbi:golvesin C-terminal-like domain-containing protein [Tichowtungia aerotolerans]|uniref:Family 16 glycosylhydrolase n=1 Tax=Tichowtungia aerotolerans TaxID=2697043 RepID=A0A6P1MB70_9BACT|nr:family 16 glycosylhydrolase [Tichowtungia aerotolerans]QHI68365.1 family 16 glycosylhydrolase [Tichowtungia aerotolerans]
MHPKTGYLLVYRDEFNDGVLNTNDWYFRAHDEPRLGGYGKKKNVSVVTENEIGMLKIAYTREDVDGDGQPDPVGGGVISTTTFGYGYYEARIKFYDEEVGFHQSFWNHGLARYTSYSDDYLYNEDAFADRVPWKNSALEIDAIELDSNYNKGGCNFHWHMPESSTPEDAHKSFSASYMDTDEWITIGFEWRPGTIVYYVDGIERHRFSYDAHDDRVAPQEIWLTGLANNSEWWGGDGYPDANAAMRVDYFRYYTKPSSGNSVGNSGFESQGSSSSAVVGWIAYDGIYDNLYSDQSDVLYNDGNAFAGLAYLRHFGKSGAPPMTSCMRLDHIPNGTYTLSAWVRSSGGMTECRMHAGSNGSGERSFDIPLLPDWTQVVIDNIEVTTHEIDLGFTAQGSDGQWLYVDEVELIHNDYEESAGDVIDNGDPGYSEFGSWKNSSLSGYRGSGTRYSDEAGAYAQWNLQFAAAGVYDVYYYKVVHSGSDPNAEITVSYNGGQDVHTVEGTLGESGWVYLGSYPFASGNAGSVRNTRQSNNARADAVMTVPASGYGELMVSEAFVDGANFVVRAVGLDPDGSYMLKFTDTLTNGFNAVVDGPRTPTPDSDPRSEMFTDPRPGRMPEQGFYRLVGE